MILLKGTPLLSLSLSRVIFVLSSKGGIVFQCRLIEPSPSFSRPHSSNGNFCLAVMLQFFEASGNLLTFMLWRFRLFDTSDTFDTIKAFPTSIF